MEVTVARYLRKMCEPAGAVASQVTAVTGAMPWTTGARWSANSTTGAGANTASAGASNTAKQVYVCKGD